MVRVLTPVALLVLGCAVERDEPRAVEVQPAPAAAPLGTGAAVQAPFDLGGVIRQVRLAFRPEGDGFRGGHATYGVEATPRGVLRVTPQGVGPDVPATRGAGLELETVMVGRAHAARSAQVRGAHSVAPDARAELDIDRGVAVEHLKNTDEGLEQSWRFAVVPPGRGDLMVRVRASGQAFAGETTTGVHFLDPKTGLGLRYGHATWIDAAGARTSVPVRLVGGVLEMRVAEGVVDRSIYPVVLDPLVSPEIGLDQPYVPAAYEQTLPEVASNGTDYLVVWQNGAARVDAEGTVLDPVGIEMPTEGPYGFIRPAVAWEGEAYLVVWRQILSAGTNPIPSIISAVRVTPSGTVSDPFAVSQEGSTAQDGPAIVVRQAESLIVWSDYRNQATTGVDLYGARLAAGGGVIDTQDLPISIAPGNQLGPAVSSNGTDYLVAWYDTRDLPTTTWDVYAAQVGADGIPLAGEIVLSTDGGAQVAPAIASDGDGYFVVWSDARNFAFDNLDLYGAHVDNLGNVLALEPGGDQLVAELGIQSMPDVAWDGSAYLLAWRDGSDIRAAHVTSDGVGGLADAPFVVSSAPNGQVGPRIDQTGSLIAWADLRNGNSDIYATRVSGSAVADPAGIAVSLGTHNQSFPAVATDGAGYLVVWEDSRGGDQNIDLYGVHVDESGAVLDPSGIVISTAPANQIRPAVASSGRGNYLVTWYDYRRVGNPQPSDVGEPVRAADIYAARVGAGGVLDWNGIVVADAATDVKVEPAVASDGTDYLVAWFVYQSPWGASISGARVATATGEVLDRPPIVISTASPGLVALAWDGASYVAAWAWGGPVTAARISPTGAVLDSNGITLTQRSASLWGPPAMASGSGGTLVAWEDQRRGEYDLYGTLLDPQGTVLAPGGVALTTAPQDQHNAALAWDGTRYLLVWGGYPNYDIGGTYVSAAGTVLYPEGFVISAAATPELLPAVASLPGSALVAYRGESLIAARRVTPDPCVDPADCTSAIACLAGACEDGTCAHEIAADSCFVAGACLTEGEPSSSNPCRVCDPSTSQMELSTAQNGTPCGGGTCAAGICVSVPPADAALADGPPADAGSADAGLADAALADAAPPDAAVLDAVPPDTAETPDGPTDAPLSLGDSASDAATMGARDDGCGCRVARRGGEASAGVLAMLAVLLLLAPLGRRRHRRSRHQGNGSL